MTDPYDIAKERKNQRLFELIQSGNTTASFILDNEIRIDGQQIRLSLTAEVLEDNHDSSGQGSSSPVNEYDAIQIDDSD